MPWYDVWKLDPTWEGSSLPEVMDRALIEAESAEAANEWVRLRFGQTGRFTQGNPPVTVDAEAIQSLKDAEEERARKVVAEDARRQKLVKELEQAQKRVRVCEEAVWSLGPRFVHQQQSMQLVGTLVNSEECVHPAHRL
jgi:hypothetical protein